MLGPRNDRPPAGVRGRMRAPGPILIGLLVAGCAGVAPPLETSATPSTTGSPVPMTALELLDCDAEPSEVGGLAEEVAVAGGGRTPDEALETFLANAPYVIPHDGYEPLGRSGDRYAYGYRSDDEVKVVVVVSPRFGELMGAAYTADELRTCPESEFGSEAEFADDRRVWTHVETGAILTDIAGPSHCGWQSARMMHVEENGILVRQYLRDPEGVFAQVPLRDTYAEGVELPPDSSDSGYRSPEGFELWFTESDNAAYVVTPEGIERWPRPVDLIGCA